MLVKVSRKLNSEDHEDQLDPRLEGHDSASDFEYLAAQFRALTKGRRHTPSEELMRQGREEA